MTTQLAKQVRAALVNWNYIDAPTTAQRALDILYTGVINPLHPRFAGGADPTATRDSTAALQAAIDYGIAHGGLLHIPYGIYTVDWLTIKDAVYTFGIQCDGALFSCVAKVQRAGVFEIVNCVDFNMVGSYKIVGNDNANYDLAVCVRAQAGTSQATSRVNIYNVTARNLKIGFGVGRYDVDYQCSEINFFGCATFMCPTAYYNGGSQSGASYVGCNLVSEPNPALVGAVDRIGWMEGGFVTIVGGEVVMAGTFNATAILLNPCKSQTYGNLYPILRITGAHIETGSQLIAILNNRNLAAPDSRSANVGILNCGGYVSGNAAAQDFIFIGDATFVGALSVKQCNFYSDTARTAYNISSTAKGARITVDRESFGRNFKNWIGGVFGGKVLHDLLPVLRVTGLAGFQIADQASKVVAFTDQSQAGELARYNGRYALGTFNVPAGGLSVAKVSAALQISGAQQLFWGVRRNGAMVAYGSRGTGQLSVQATLYDLVECDTIDIFAQALFGAVAFDGAIAQTFEIFGATS